MARKRRILWRCKGLADGCKTVAEMVAALEGAAKELQKLAEQGAEVDGGEVVDDYADLVITPKKPRAYDSGIPRVRPW